MGCGASCQRQSYHVGETVMIVKKDDQKGKMAMVKSTSPRYIGDIPKQEQKIEEYRVYSETGVERNYKPWHIAPAAQLTTDDERALKARFRSQQHLTLKSFVRIFSDDVNGPEGAPGVVEFRRSDGDYGVYFEDGSAAWYKPVSLVEQSFWPAMTAEEETAFENQRSELMKRLHPTFKVGDFVKFKNDDMYGRDGVSGIVDAIVRKDEILVYVDDDSTGCIQPNVGHTVKRGAMLCSSDYSYLYPIVPAQLAAEEECRLKTLCETREEWRHSLKVDDAVIPFEKRGDDWGPGCSRHTTYYEGPYAFIARFQNQTNGCFSFYEEGAPMVRLKGGDGKDHEVHAHMMKPADEAEAKKWGFPTCYSRRHGPE